MNTWTILLLLFRENYILFACFKVILTERFVLMYFGLLLNPTLPEGDFLNAYGFSGTVPVLFTVILYIVYLFILFVYHYELKQHVPGSGGGIGLRISGGLNVRALLEKNNGSPRHFSGIPDAPAGSNSNITNAIPKNGVQYHHGANPNLNNHHNTIISRPWTRWIYKIWKMKENFDRKFEINKFLTNFPGLYCKPHPSFTTKTCTLNFIVEWN